MNNTCPTCQKEEANSDPEYGLLPCDLCQDEARQIPKPSQATTYDFASPTTKAQRKEYGSEMFQPFVDGVLSREFIEAHGTSKLAGVTKEQIKNAKYVYKGMTRHHKMVEDGAKKGRERGFVR